MHKTVRFNLLYLLLFSFALQFTTPLESAPSKPVEDVQDDEEFDFNIWPTKSNNYPYILDYVAFVNNSWRAFFTDGSVWKLEDCRDDNFIQVLSQWKSGDEIRLYPRFFTKKKKRGDWFLKNMSNDTVFYGHIQTLPVVPLVITSIDSQGYFITLSDGSQWTISWLESWTSFRWVPGNKILVNRGAGGSHVMINCDTQTDILASLTVWK